MTRRAIVLLFTLLMAVPVFSQGPSLVFFVCGNKDHTPSHSAANLDDARALTRRHGCSGWRVHSPYRGNLMPIPNQAYMAEQAKRRTLFGQLDGLNEYSKTTARASAWKRLRPENLRQQPFSIVVTSTQIGGDAAKRFRIAVSSARATPELFGYLTVAGVWEGEIFEVFAPTERFVEVPRTLQSGTATYEFDYSPEQATKNGPSQFTLADAPLDRIGTTPKNVYWFYLQDFESR